MTIRKRLESYTDSENNPRTLTALYQGGSCDGSNPVNVTISWSGKKVNELGSSIFLSSFFRST